MVRPDDSDRSLDAMCDDIIERYHAALHRSLPRIRDTLVRLTQPDSTTALRHLSVAFGELADQVERHLAKEEHLLFPALASLAAADREGGNRPSLPFSTVLHPIRLMEAEHVRIELALDALHEAALAVVEPESLSQGFRECMTELSRLDEELREHHRAEDAVLFPRAMEVERRLL
jgi:regulator of cell morphogenesis and NO signaling